MALFALVIFNKGGHCVYRKLWGDCATKFGEHELKLLFGMIFQTKYFAKTMTPRELGPFEEPQTTSFTTKEYKLSVFESVSGWRLCLFTDPSVSDLEGRNALQRVYELLVQFVVKNPLSALEGPIESSKFVHASDLFMSTLSFNT